MTTIFSLFLSLFVLAAHASVRDDIQFHDLFQSALGPSTPAPHFNLDAATLQMLSAASLDEAMKLSQQSSLESLIEAQRSHQARAYDVDGVLKRRTVTLVIVPGIFGELISNRAFEEVLRQKSLYRAQFAKLVAQAPKALASDPVFSLETLASEDQSLDEVMHAASFDQQGQVLLKVVLLFARPGSLETLIDQKLQAEIFNRRLGKYLALSGDQTVALVGYSRGLATALEMVSQAEQSHAEWLGRVKAVVSLGGVNLGSTLADDALSESSQSGQLLASLRTLLDSLTPIPSTAEWYKKDWIIAENSAAWASFGFKVGRTLTENFSKTYLSEKETEEKENAATAQGSNTTQAALGLDMAQMIHFVLAQAKLLGLYDPVGDYSNNIIRFQKMFRAVIKGTEQLTTGFRLKWWQTHQLPSSVHYYALGAAMADPAASKLEGSLWANPQLYARNFEDYMLLGSHRQYKELVQISLNDSQVALPQTHFLDQVIAKLNPSQAPLKTSSLGILNGHHWALALQTVYAARKPNPNPFPREALLKALAAKIALDQPVSDSY